MTINLLNCNLGIRRLWRGVACDLQACFEAPQLVTALWPDQTQAFSFYNSTKLGDLSRDDYLNLVATESERAIDFLLTRNQASGRIVVGGDHMVSFASLAADLRCFPTQEVALLMFDSHDDFNLAQASATGNFHGMWVRPFFTSFDHSAIEALIPEKLPLENLLYVGNLDMEAPVANFFREKKIRVLDQQAWENDFAGTLRELQTFINKFPHLHLSFDLDVVAGQADPALATSGDWAVNLPFSRGLPLTLVQQIWQNLSFSPSSNLDLVEYNSRRFAGVNQTLELAQKVIQSWLD